MYAVIDHKSVAGTANTADMNTTGAKLLVAWIGFYSGGATPTIVDGKGGVWINLQTYDTANTPKGCFAWCPRPIVGSGHHWNLSGGSWQSLSVVALSAGANSGQIQNAINGGNGSSLTSKQTGGITPTAPSVILAAMSEGFNAISGLAIDSGFTILESLARVDGVNMGNRLAILNQGNPKAAVNPNWTWTGAADIIVSAVSFNENDMRVEANRRPSKPYPFAPGVAR